MTDDGGSGVDWADARTVVSDDVEDTRDGAAPSLAARLRRALQQEGRTAARVGRFFIQGELGSGGMGTVFAALDTELDRSVAVKLVHHDPNSGRAKIRLRREAQALAQLSHPNVVPVFEVGEHDGHTFIAMELVQGANLSQWLKASPRSWHAVLDKFLQAGAGLVAAHEVGLVHRDFKPHNVLVGNDGRVRVVDFGLATDKGATADDTQDWAPASGIETASLTLTGEVLGTPAFMSPEQFSGGHVGPASDQFAFCSALFQALAGHRPFKGESVADLSRSVQSGQAKHLPPGAYPQAIDAVLARGLTREAAERYPSMKVLLTELGTFVQDAPPRRSRLTWVLGLATVSMTGALVWSLTQTNDGIGARDDPPRAIATAPPEHGPVAAPQAAPPHGPAPNFDGLATPRGQLAIEHYEAGCQQFADGRVRAATSSFGAASADFAVAQGDPIDAARIQYARAVAHLAVFDRDRHNNDLRIAYELLRRLSRNGGVNGTSPSTDGLSPKSESPLPMTETSDPAVMAFERVTARPDLVAAGIDLAAPSRFVVAFFNDAESGSEMSIDGQIIGHQPCSGAVPLDRGGYTIVTRHPLYYDHMLMWNPRELNATPPPAQQRVVPPGRQRKNQDPWPMDRLVKLPAVVSTPADWPQ